MSSVCVSIPTLGRPNNAWPLVKSCRESFGHEHELRIVFSCSPGDVPTIKACRETKADVVVVEWPQPARADWARKQNAVFASMEEEWILLGGDDIIFRPGWFDQCLAVHEKTNACVIGTNDMGNERVLRGEHSTHPLVHRDYIHCGGVVDDPTKLVPEVYGHWYVDDEFVRTAMARGTYAHAHEALVEHMHPVWGKAEDDSTYEISKRTLNSDRMLFQQRRRLWQ